MMKLKKVSPEKLLIAANQKKKERDFWLNRLSGDFVKSNFPFDYEKGKEQAAGKDTLDFIFPEPTALQLIKLSNESDYSLNVILTAGLIVLLSKYTACCDIAIGTPIYKQDTEDTEEEFINTVLVIRQRFNEHDTFKQILNQTGQIVVEATEHYNYPLELLNEKLNLPQVAGDFPFFDVVILLRTIHDKSCIEHLNPHITFSFDRIREKLPGQIEYDSLLYSRSTIERIMLHYTRLVHSALFNVELTLSDIIILTGDEKRQILRDFNDTTYEYLDKTVQRLFEEQVEKTPDRTAAAHIDSSAERSPLYTITYRELNRKSNRLARFLRDKGVGPAVIVGIMAERSIETIIGLAAILKADAAYLPIDPDYPAARKKYICEDSNISLIITQGSGSPGAHDIPEGIEQVDIEDLADRPPIEEENLDIIYRPTHPVYVIYTSGSTGAPKGVAVDNSNLTNLIFGLGTIIYDKYDRYLRVCLVAPFIFDASVKQVFAALLRGHSLFIVPEDARLDSFKLAALYDKYDIDISDGTPTHLRMLRESLPGNIKNGKSPVNVRRFIIGGEAMPRMIVEEFFDHFNMDSLKITNVYGPTECCVDSVSFEVTKENLYKYINIPIGAPMPNQHVYITDCAGNLQPIGIPGELSIGGAGVSRGYLNSPGLTAEKFIVDNRSYMSYMSNESYSFKKLYRTGDCARWLADGNIEFLGRLDQQVKISGYRIEPGEIEHQLRKHKKIKDALVLDREMPDGDKYLCAYVVMERCAQTQEIAPVDAAELRELLSESMPHYMIPSYFISIPGIPITANGKIDRRALPQPSIDAAERYAAPRNEIEMKLVEIWARVLGIKEEKIGIDADFFTLGGNSLKGTVVLSKIHKEYNTRILLRDLFRIPHIRGLSVLVKQAAAERYISIKPVERKEFYSLSSAQKRLYILDQMEFKSIAYNMPMVFQIGKKLDCKRLEIAFKKLLHRHESFRTSFFMIDDEQKQHIHDPREIDFEIAYYTTAGVNRSLDSIIEKFVRPFDLSKAPLIRAGLLYNPTHTGSQPQPQAGAPGDSYIILIDIHHIISDGISMEIFHKELVELYDSRELTPLRLQYKDYVQWQNREFLTQKTKKQAEFWLQEFPGEIPVLQLPLDYTRPAVYSFAGDTISFEISRTGTAALKEIVREEKATLFMILVALLNVLLAKLSGQEDIVIGIPAAGRPHPDLENIIGMFINTLALRNYPQEGKRFDLFLQEVKNKTIRAFENQEFQFDDLVESLAVTRKADRNPLFDVMFVFQNMETYQVENPGLELIPRSIDSRVSKFDLILGVKEAGDDLFFSMDYNTSIFKAESIERFGGYFKEIVSKILTDRKMKLEEIKIYHSLFEQRLDNPVIDFSF